MEAPDILLSLLQTIHADVQEVREEQKKQGQALADHIATEPEEWAAQLSGLLAEAFPDGDPEGHRKYHEETIKAMEARSEFWKKMLFEVTK